MRSFLGSWLCAALLVFVAGQAVAQKPDARETAREELREAKRQAREAERTAREAAQRAEEAERKLDAQEDDDSDEADLDDARTKKSPTLTVGGPAHSVQHVTLGSDVNVPAGAEVDSAVSLGGSVAVGDGAVVHDDVVAMGGNITIGEHAIVEGDLVSMGGSVTVAPTAVIKGNRVNMGPQSPAIGKVFHAAALPWGIIGVVASIVRVLLLFALATLAVMLMPRRMSVMQAFLTQRVAVSAVAGFAALAAIVPFCVLLVVTLVGIPLVPVAVVVFLLAMVVGFAVVAVTIGARLPLLQNRKTIFTSLVLGFAVLTVLDFALPWIGTVLVFSASLVGMGAVMLSRLGQTREAPPSSTALTQL
jgi:hypothetical protein